MTINSNVFRSYLSQSRDRTSLGMLLCKLSELDGGSCELTGAHCLHTALGYEDALFCIVHSDEACDDKLKRLSLLSEPSMSRKSLGMLWGLWGA